VLTRSNATWTQQGSKLVGLGAAGSRSWLPVHVAAGNIDVSDAVKAREGSFHQLLELGAVLGLLEHLLGLDQVGDRLIDRDEAGWRAVPDQHELGVGVLALDPAHRADPAVERRQRISREPVLSDEVVRVVEHQILHDQGLELRQLNQKLRVGFAIDYLLVEEIEPDQLFAFRQLVGNPALLVRERSAKLAVRRNAFFKALVGRGLPPSRR
jgi:hypothetical protein